jgi:hypothetical protein
MHGTKLTTSLELECQDELFVNMLNGVDKNQSFNELSAKYGITISTFVRLEGYVIDSIKKKTVEHLEHILPLHLMRYEEIYSWFKKHELYKEGLKALYQKEKLMGLHSELYEVQINNIFSEFDQMEQYDTTRLSFKEKARFYQLLKKVAVD